MNFDEVKDKDDFKVYLEERARYKSLSNLYELTEDNDVTDMKRCLKEDFNVENKNIKQAMIWLKEICSKTYMIEDISHMLKEHKEVLKLKGILFFSAGMGIHKGFISDGGIISDNEGMYKLSSIKQLWKQIEIK